MSRFIEKLKKQAESPPQPMGFHKTLPAESITTILIVAKVAIDDGGSPVTNIDGADGVLLYDEKNKITMKTLSKIVKPLQNTPWGIFLDESEDTAQALVESGCDFAVLSPTCPVSAVPQAEKVGKILHVESTMDDGLLRAVNDLPVDAVLAADTFEENGKLVWHHLMILRYMAMLVNKPLLVPVSPTIDQAELKALWDAGIEAVVVPVDISKGENLKDLHDMSVKLLPRAVKKAHKVDVFLPSVSGRQAEPPEEEEEPEEDE
jgi:hypothetical protein